VYPLESIVEAQARNLPRGSTMIIITPSALTTVYKTADMLLRRGLRPLLVLLDAATFGGHTSLDNLIVSLEFLRLPVCRVKCGENLTVALSVAVSSHFISPMG
jgi:hypothetical protein